MPVGEKNERITDCSHLRTGTPEKQPLPNHHSKSVERTLGAFGIPRHRCTTSLLRKGVAHARGDPFGKLQLSIINLPPPANKGRKSPAGRGRNVTRSRDRPRIGGISPRVPRRQTLSAVGHSNPSRYSRRSKAFASGDSGNNSFSGSNFKWGPMEMRYFSKSTPLSLK